MAMGGDTCVATPYARTHKHITVRRTELRYHATSTSYTHISHYTNSKLASLGATILCKHKDYDMNCFLVAMSSLTNKNPRINNHSNFIYPCQVYIFETTNHKLNPSFKRNIFCEHSPWVLGNVLYLYATASCVDAYWLIRQPITWSILVVYASASSSTKFIHYCVARYSTYIPRVQRAAQFAHLMFTLSRQRTKKAFRNLLRCLRAFFKAFFCWYECMSPSKIKFSST